MIDTAAITICYWCEEEIRPEPGTAVVRLYWNSKRGEDPWRWPVTSWRNEWAPAHARCAAEVMGRVFYRLPSGAYHYPWGCNNEKVGRAAAALLAGVEPGPDLGDAA